MAHTNPNDGKPSHFFHHLLNGFQSLLARGEKQDTNNTDVHNTKRLD